MGLVDHLIGLRSQAGNAGLLLALLGIATAVFVIKSVVLKFRRYLRLRHIPGPPTTGWSRLWLLRQALAGDAHKAYYETNEKYGQLAKVGPYHVITSDPDLIRRINGARTSYVRSEWYQALRFDPDNHNIATCPIDKHFELRAKMAAGYSGKEVDGVEAKVDRNILALIRLIETRYVATNRAFDFGRKAQYFTLDVISDVAYGDPFGFLEKDRDQYDYIRITENHLGLMLMMTVYPWILTLLSSPFLKSLSPSDKDLVGFGKLMGIAKEKASERFGSNKKVQRDMLGSFVAHGLSQKEAESEILFQMQSSSIAGSDTTATGVRCILLLIITTPRVHNALLSEIANLEPTLTADEVVSDKQARSMAYLQAVIKEGLRWFPPVAGMLSKQVPPEGDEWKGVRLPRGTLVGYNAWGVMRAKHIWGDDAAEFRPERWLEATPERLKEMEATQALTFGYGKWQCLGREIALMELNKVFVELLRRFDLSVIDPIKPMNTVNASIFLQSEYWMKAYRRAS